jgi:hypothetical protein
MKIAVHVVMPTWRLSSRGENRECNHIDWHIGDPAALLRGERHSMGQQFQVKATTKHAKTSSCTSQIKFVFIAGKRG